jgi:hypothetical protein
VKQYPDAQQHYEAYTEQRVDEIKAEARQLGLTMNKTVARKIAERVMDEAEADYKKQSAEVFLHNFYEITEDHKRRMNEIKRSGARLRLIFCPPIAAFFLLLGFVFYHFGLWGAAGVQFVLAFIPLAFLVGGAIFDRPSR